MQDEMLDALFSTIYFLTGAVGITSNILLIMCIFTRTPKSLKKYSVLLTNSAITELVFSLSSTLAQIRLIPNGFYFSYIALGPVKFLGPRAAYEMYSMQLHSIFYSFLTFPLSFGFRYYVLVRPIPSVPKIVGMCLALWSLVICQHLMFHFSQMDPQEVRYRLQESYPQYNLSGYVICGNYHMLEHPLVTVVLLTIILPMFPIYGLVISYYLRVQKFLKFKESEMSFPLIRNHRRLMTALSIQASLPILFVFPPICLYIMYHLRMLQLKIIEYLVFALFSFYPAASPIITIYFVRPYKDAFDELFVNVSRRPLQFFVCLIMCVAWFRPVWHSHPYTMN